MTLDRTSLNVLACHKCLREAHIECGGHCPCPHDKDNRDIGDHAVASYCPRSLFRDNAPRPEGWEKTPEPVRVMKNGRVIDPHAYYHTLWREFHRWPINQAEIAPAAFTKFFADWASRIPCGDCRRAAERLFKSDSPDFSSRRALFCWTVRFHNAVNAHLNKPKISDARAARVHGAVSLFTEDEIAEDRQLTGPVNIAIDMEWGLGDAVCLTAALRDILCTWPGEFQFFMRSRHVAVFSGLPGVHPSVPDDQPLDIQSGIAGGHPEPQGNGEHLIEFFRRRMAEIINRRIPDGGKKPWLARPEEGESPVDGEYWAVAANHKSDITVKSWSPERWQVVVDALVARGIKLVRIGSTSGHGGVRDIQPDLKGFTLDLTGKTDEAEMIRLIAHPNCIGTISLESSPPHIAAAFDKRAIVLGGSRIKSSTVRYGVPRESWIADESIPCANCGRYRTFPDSPNDNNTCIMPGANGHTACMNRITPEQVIAAVTGDKIEPKRRGPLRVGLCSYYSPNIASWAWSAALRMQSYCLRHGYFYAPFDPAKPPSPRGPRWQKPEILSRHLCDLDWLAWVDADCAIVRPEFRIESVLEYGEADVYLTRDKNGLNNGVIIFRNTEASFELLMRWKQADEHPERRNSDQDEIELGIKRMGDRIKVIYLPKPLINAYDESHAEPGDECPGWLIHCVDDHDKHERMMRWLSSTH